LLFVTITAEHGPDSLAGHGEMVIQDGRALIGWETAEQVRRRIWGDES
jgi:hypothetical protein